MVDEIFLWVRSGNDSVYFHRGGSVNCSSPGVVLVDFGGKGSGFVKVISSRIRFFDICDRSFSVSRGDDIWVIAGVIEEIRASDVLFFRVDDHGVEMGIPILMDFPADENESGRR